MSDQISFIENDTKEPVLTRISVDDVTPNEYIAAPAPSRGLKESISEFGVIQSIVVAVNTGSDPWKYHIVAGRRRLMACRELAIAKIPAIIFDDEADAERFARMSTAENSIRSPNIMSDMWSIKTIREKRPGIDVSTKQGINEIARLTALPYSVVVNRLKLFNLPKEVINATFEGRFPASKLETVAGLSKKARDGVAARLSAGEKLTGKDVTEAKANQTAERLAMQPVLPMEFAMPDEYSFYGTFDNGGEVVITKNEERWITIGAEHWDRDFNVVVHIANLLAMIADGEDADTILTFIDGDLPGVCVVSE